MANFGILSHGVAAVVDTIADDAIAVDSLAVNAITPQVAALIPNLPLLLGVVGDDDRNLVLHDLWIEGLHNMTKRFPCHCVL
jgi:hypothetical protein